MQMFSDVIFCECVWKRLKSQLKLVLSEIEMNISSNRLPSCVSLERESLLYHLHDHQAMTR